MPTELKRMKALAIDIQATGHNPHTAHLLEIGWCKTTASDHAGISDAQGITSELILIPHDAVIPSHVQKVTGLKPHHFESAIPAKKAWAALFQDAKVIAHSQGLVSCPTIIHYARFEKAFLLQLEKIEGYFPLCIICTHQIACRLLPELPRKGLRALAGYLGHSVPHRHRCRNHLSATKVIWRALVKQLIDQTGIHTLGQLFEWLSTSQIPIRSTDRTYPMPKTAIRALPNSPGVYRMRRSNRDLLYIGKAKSLKQRVTGYFQPKRRHSESILEMLCQATILDITPTRSALEAALLESDEIKSYHPPYNTALKSERRQLKFVSGDFGHFSNQYSQFFQYGPVLRTDPFVAVHALGTRLMDPSLSNVGDAEILALLQDKHPAPEILGQGLKLFHQKYASFFDPEEPWLSFRRIGRTIWKRNKEAATPDKQKSCEKASKKARPQSFVWTAEAVVRFMENNLSQCGYLLRRSCWYTILSESVVAWQSTIDTSLANVIVISGGNIVSRLSQKLNTSLPWPCVVDKPHTKRVSAFDLKTYDRLRILTTELRRLIAENRWIVIRLNTAVFLKRKQISNLLYWI